MKTSCLRPQFAFTLVELLTVIAIIAVLMGLLFPALQGARDNARRADAGTMVRNIVNASKAYYNDYGKYPPNDEALVEEGTSGGAGSTTVKGSYYAYGDVEIGADKVKVNTNQLFDILRAIAATPHNEDHKMNRRQQKYFEGKKATDIVPRKTRGGFADGQEFTDRKGRLYDPWGTEYFIILDADGNEEINVSKFWTDLADENGTIRFSAGAFSIAKDAVFGGKGYPGMFRKSATSNEAPDDIVSWQ